MDDLKCVNSLFVDTPTPTESQSPLLFTFSPSTVLASSQTKETHNKRSDLNVFKTTMQTENRMTPKYTTEQINSHALRSSVIESIRGAIFKTIKSDYGKKQLKASKGCSLTVDGLNELTPSMASSIENEIKRECIKQFPKGKMISFFDIRSRIVIPYLLSECMVFYTNRICKVDEDSKR